MTTQYNQSTSLMGQLFDSKLNKTRTKSNDPLSSIGFNNNYNANNYSNFDTETLREELLKIKSDFNKKNQELHCLRIAYKKVETENLEITNLVEDILTEANKKLLSLAEEMISYSDEDFIAKLSANISKETTAKLFSKYLMLKMKHEIVQLREEIKKRDNEIYTLKSTTKVSKYQDLDNKYAQTSLELAEITEKYKLANQIQNEMQNQTHSLLVQLDDYHKEMTKQKMQLNRTQKELTVHQKEQEEKTQEATKSKERKLGNALHLSAKQLKEKDREIFGLRQRINELEKKQLEIRNKEQNDKDNKAKDEQLKEELKRKNMKIKDLETKNLEYFFQLEQAKNKKQPMKPITKFERENIALKEENKKLTNEIKTLKEQIKKLQSNTGDNKSLEEAEEEYNEFETKSNKQEKEKEENNNNNEDNVFITGKVNTNKSTVNHLSGKIKEQDLNDSNINNSKEQSNQDKEESSVKNEEPKKKTHDLQPINKELNEKNQSQGQNIIPEHEVSEKGKNDIETPHQEDEYNNIEEYNNEFQQTPQSKPENNQLSKPIPKAKKQSKKGNASEQNKTPIQQEPNTDNNNNNKEEASNSDDKEEYQQRNNNQNPPSSTEEYRFSSKDKKNYSHEQSNYNDEEAKAKAVIRTDENNKQLQQQLNNEYDEYAGEFDQADGNTNEYNNEFNP